MPNTTDLIAIDCRRVWKELVHYMESDLTPDFRRRIEAHLTGCRHCSAIYDGTRNVAILFADARAVELPAGFSERLYQRLAVEAR